MDLSLMKGYTLSREDIKVDEMERHIVELKAENVSLKRDYASKQEELMTAAALLAKANERIRELEAENARLRKTLEAARYYYIGSGSTKYKRAE